MSAVWYTILLAIDQRNQVIEAQDAIIDIEVKNLDDLLTELKILQIIGLLSLKKRGV